MIDNTLNLKKIKDKILFGNMDYTALSKNISIVYFLLGFSNNRN